MKIALTSDTHHGFHEKDKKCITKHLISNMFKVMTEEKPDIIVHAGDWGNSCVQHTAECVGFLRKCWDGPVISVKGANHDLWQTGDHLSFVGDRLKNNDLIFLSNHIHSRYIGEGLLIVSWSGWYSDPNPPSNDAFYIPSPPKLDIHAELRRMAVTEWSSVKKLLKNKKYDGWKKILVTHFNVFNDPPAIPQDISEVDKKLMMERYYGMSGDLRKFDEMVELGVTHICYGHTHKADNSVQNGVHLLNCGSDYNDPRFMIFEV